MLTLAIEVPDPLARELQDLAAAQQKTVQQLALECLNRFIKGGAKPGSESAAALLRALHEPPYLSAADVAELDAAIAAGRPPLSSGELFGSPAK